MNLNITDTTSAAGRRRNNICVNAEDNALDQITKEAESRLAARRQARAEAREIRMRELERQQKKQEQNADRAFDMQNISGNLLTDTTFSSNTKHIYGGFLNLTRPLALQRFNEDSIEDESYSVRDFKHELKVVEERFRNAMITNAQLDNDRSSQAYEVKLLKDKTEILQESISQLQREFKNTLRDCNALKRHLERCTLELTLVQGQLSERDDLIKEHGLVIVAIENKDGSNAKRTLVSVDNANVLAAGNGTFDEKQRLLLEVQKLHEQINAYKNEEGFRHRSSLHGSLENYDDYEIQRESNKIITDYKYKLQKAEQEIGSLQANLARSETQVIRYKSTAEASEKAEAELKIERRKLQREHREILERLEEAETANNHLLKRLDKLKCAKSTLLKDL